jgi:hypothetical protein
MRRLVEKGAPERAKLDEIQMAIADVQKGITTIERAPLSSEATRANLRRALDHELNEGFVERTLSRFAQPNPAYAGELPKVDWPLLAMLLGRETVEEKLLGIIQGSQKAPGLTHQEREARLDELRGELRRLEVDEERAILALETSGFVVLRRSDADPALVLQVWQDEPQREQHQAATRAAPPRAELAFGEGGRHSGPWVPYRRSYRELATATFPHGRRPFFHRR